MKTRVLVLAALLGSAAAQNKPQPVTVSDPNVILSLLNGEVTMLGATFPNMTFQKGVLTRLKARQISKLTLLTTLEQVKNMTSLRTLGAAVYYLPVSGVRITGNIVLAGNDTVIYQRDQNWTVIQANQLAVQARNSLTLYFSQAKRY